MEKKQQEVSERSNLIASLRSDFRARVGYIKSKVGTLVPSQIRGLRLKSETPTQPALAEAANMHQSRISMLETAGSNPTVGTLSEIAAALRVGLKIEFVSFSEMLDWENRYSQDEFRVTKLDNDQRFLNPFAVVSAAIPAVNVATEFYRPTNTVAPSQIPDTSWITVRFLGALTGDPAPAIWTDWGSLALDDDGNLYRLAPSEPAKKEFETGIPVYMLAAAQAERRTEY